LDRKDTRSAVYYDWRVRKEAFSLERMMGLMPGTDNVPAQA
jgi:hypothetical protein